jgi:hypothetical protein
VKQRALHREDRKLLEQKRGSERVRAQSSGQSRGAALMGGMRAQVPIENGRRADATMQERKLMLRQATLLQEMLTSITHRVSPEDLRRGLPPKLEVLISLRMPPALEQLYCLAARKVCSCHSSAPCTLCAADPSRLCLVCTEWLVLSGGLLLCSHSRTLHTLARAGSHVLRFRPLLLQGSCRQHSCTVDLDCVLLPSVHAYTWPGSRAAMRVASCSVESAPFFGTAVPGKLRCWAW